MPELLHNHIIVRVNLIFNVSASKTQATYACASQRLGCSWARIIQVDGDAFALPESLKALKQAEAGLLPKPLLEAQDDV